jgi:integrase/recombinase XerD
MAKSNENHMNAGDLASLVVEFRRHLSGLGHTRLTVIRYDASARHFAHWLAQAEIAVADINDVVINRFRQHRCRCPGTRRAKLISGRYVRRVRRFVEFLAERGVVQHTAKRAAAVYDRRVVEFQDWLRQHRGICE